MKSVNYKNTVEGFCEMRSKQMCEFSNDFFWHKRRMLVNDNIAEYNVSQEKKKLSHNYPRWRYRHDKPACRLLKTSQESHE